MSRHAIPGIVAHDVIAAFLTARQRGQTYGPAEAQRSALLAIERIWSNPNASIWEFYNGGKAHFEEPERQARLVQARLRRFFQVVWPHFARLDYEMHEEGRAFRVGRTVVMTRLDYAGWDVDDRFVIVDWKTGGKATEEEAREQLGIYALYATDVLRLDSDRLVLALASLRSGQVQYFSITPADLVGVRERLRSDLARLRTMRVSKAFPADPEPDKCRGCAFLALCTEGQTVTT